MSWPSKVPQLQAWAWNPIITAVIHIICCSPGSVEFLSVLVTLPQLVDVQANVESPLLFERSCRRLSLTAYSSVSRPPDPHRARRPGCKRSRSSSYVAEMNSWQRSVPLGSAVRCQSQRGGKEHLPEWLSEKDGWGGSPVLLQQPLKTKLFALFWQSNLPRVNTSTSSSVSNPDAWWPTCGDCDELLMVFSMTLPFIGWHFYAKIAFHTLEMNSDIEGPFK